MKFFRQIIWIFVLILISRPTYADSTVRAVTLPSHAKKAAVRKDEKVANPTIEMDLMGDGKMESFKAKTTTHLTSKGDVDYSQLTLFRMKPDGAWETVSKWRYP